MATIVLTDSPRALLRLVYAGIDEGAVHGWAYDHDGDLTMTSENLSRLAWFRPSIGEDRLVFNMVGRKGGRTNRYTYAVYHGRIIQMLLTHFDERFSRATATSMPTAADEI